MMLPDSIGADGSLCYNWHLADAVVKRASLRERRLSLPFVDGWIA